MSSMSVTAMKLIRCHFEVDHLERIISALMDLSTGMTLWDAREDSKEVNRRAIYRGQSYEVSPPRYVLEVVSDDSWVDDILRALAEVNKSDPFGDHHVCVYPVEASYHVRTGFSDV